MLLRRLAAPVVRRYRGRRPASSLGAVCVVGSGPGGFYTAKYLLKADANVRVDVIDKLPTPFGLVRSGVAPDHQDVKAVQNDFTNVAQNERVRFFGNVRVGDGDGCVGLDELRKCYGAVVLACGAEDDRTLGIAGEELRGVHGARAFVNWYNGHPDFVGLAPDLSCAAAVIVGQGNVAIDCARILCKTQEELRGSDIAAHAQEALAASNIRHVSVVGRRGHVQASFTIKELRELTKLQGAAFGVRADELQQGATAASLEEVAATRAKKRLNDLLNKHSGSADAADAAGMARLELRFLASPVAVLPDAADAGRAGALRVERTALEGDAFEQVMAAPTPPRLLRSAHAARLTPRWPSASPLPSRTRLQRAVGQQQFEDISCGLILRSIG